MTRIVCKHVKDAYSVLATDRLVNSLVPR